LYLLLYRRGTDEKGNKIEYFIHPEAVAEIVQRLKQSHKIAHLVAAAYLHDTVEDTNVNIIDIRREFGELVASLVEELTSDEEQLKIMGKKAYLTQKLLTMSSWGLVIKLADRLHNVSDIPDIMDNGTNQRKKWAKKYASQTKAMITTLEKKRELSRTQQIIVQEIKDKIKNAIEQ
jgi:(p)ppGpp synthase/HD superfamily hydrolase